jgi:hypothetical protein
MMVTWIRVRPFMIGFLGALSALLIGLLLGLIVLIWVRASHGEQAYQYLIQQEIQRKAAQPKG